MQPYTVRVYIRTLHMYLKEAFHNPDGHQRPDVQLGGHGGQEGQDGGHEDAHAVDPLAPEARGQPSAGELGQDVADEEGREYPPCRVQYVRTCTHTGLVSELMRIIEKCSDINFDEKIH